jgi:hypothetical protein
MSWFGDEIRKLNQESMNELMKHLIEHSDTYGTIPPEKSHEILKSRGYALSESFKENCKILEQKYGIGVSLSGEYIILDTVRGVQPSQIKDEVIQKLERQCKKLEDKGYFVESGFTGVVEDEEIKKTTFLFGISEIKGLFRKKKTSLIVINENKFMYSMYCLVKPELRQTVDLLAIELYDLHPK